MPLDGNTFFEEGLPREGALKLPDKFFFKLQRKSVSKLGNSQNFSQFNPKM